MKQLELLRRESKSYGGDFLKKRKGRAHGRPLSTSGTMHLVLRSTQAKGRWSFSQRENRLKVTGTLEKFARKNGIRLESVAVVYNHLHIHLKLSSRHTYRAFIRAVTAAIAMAVTGTSRWRKLARRFWDRRPFSRVVKGRRAYLTLRDYIEVNQLEGVGVSREEARARVAWKYSRSDSSYAGIP